MSDDLMEDLAACMDMGMYDEEDLGGMGGVLVGALGKVVPVAQKKDDDDDDDSSSASSSSSSDQDDADGADAQVIKNNDDKKPNTNTKQQSNKPLTAKEKKERSRERRLRKKQRKEERRNSKKENADKAPQLNRIFNKSFNPNIKTAKQLLSEVTPGPNDTQCKLCGCKISRGCHRGHMKGKEHARLTQQFHADYKKKAAEFKAKEQQTQNPGKESEAKEEKSEAPKKHHDAVRRQREDDDEEE